ncbi:hypothetical protein [Halospeciosus flavus]|uniref:DUF2250 domain-containing protein n=1 Tax=Halospeciosus flavus TaxID=3032283 RepID=A0ABD5Z3R1_9EURY|nr:hypothetical protein [Halospeciosus flavus]
MSDASHPGDELRPTDRAILEFLAGERVEYAAIVANRVGLHTPLAERRCAALVERGYLEAVSGEVVYRITEEGRYAVER